MAVTLDRGRAIALGDRWDRLGGRVYTAAIQMHAGRLGGGQTASMKFALALRGAPEHVPARLTVDTATRRYQLHRIWRRLFGARVARFTVHAEQPESG